MSSQSTAWRDLTPLIAPRSVAIVGTSQRGAHAYLAREPHRVDINPLIVLPKGKGLVAVDALVEIK